MITALEALVASKFYKPSLEEKADLLIRLVRYQQTSALLKSSFNDHSHDEVGMLRNKLAVAGYRYELRTFVGKQEFELTIIWHKI